jgi:hypothetical protein
MGELFLEYAEIRKQYLEVKGDLVVGKAGS